MGSPKHFPASNWCWERELWQEQDKLCRRRTSARGISSQLVSLDCGVNGMKATTRAITSTHVAGNIRIFCILFCNTCFLVLLPAWWAHTHIHIYTHTHTLACKHTCTHWRQKPSWTSPGKPHLLMSQFPLANHLLGIGRLSPSLSLSTSLLPFSLASPLLLVVVVIDIGSWIWCFLMALLVLTTASAIRTNLAGK